ncbi:Eco57I restriction-modification methylase domain-containing protein [Faecalimonas sp. LCP19S3_D12]
MSNNCQVQTPDAYVKKLLDYVGYNNNLLGKRVLENSCGEGNILAEIVERYICDLRENKYEDIEIVKGIENDIVGYEKDPKLAAVCVDKLERIRVSQKLPKVHWNIKIEDYLVEEEQKYEYIIGNPPYITYHDLKIEERKWLQKSFDSCKVGRCDYYYAFVEKSIKSLAENGKLAYLVPFSIFRNKSAEQLRELIRASIIDIYDFTGEQIFPGVITSSTIIVCDNENRNSTIKYHHKNIDKVVDKSTLGAKWFFVDDKYNQAKFGEYFRVCNGVATLCNEAFLITEYEQDEYYAYVGDAKIEKEMLLPAVSTKTLKRQKKTKKEEKIIFPYIVNKKGYKQIDEKEFMEKYPETVKYLEKFRDKLLKRKVDSKVSWYEYGRTQALNEVYGEKLVFPMVITSRVKAYKVKNMTVPYAGYFVKKIENGKYSLSLAKKILESKDFYNYVKEHGTPTTATSYRISVREIENYKFDPKLYE